MTSHQTDIEDLTTDSCSTTTNSGPISQHTVIIPTPSNQTPQTVSIGKVFLVVYGCSHANSDGEYIGGQLEKAGYSFVEKIEDSDVCVVYGCTVKNPSEDSFLNTVLRGVKLGKKVVGCGCVSQADPENVNIPPGVALVGVRELNRIVEVVAKLRQGEVLRLVPRVAKRLSKAERRKLGRAGYHPGLITFSFSHHILFSHTPLSFIFY